MPDWTQSMQQTFEYYIVDPNTWGDIKRVENIKSCTIKRDTEAGTLGSATINVTDMLGECYIRVYLITIQNGVREKFPLGTYLAQTPSYDYDGRLKTVTIDAYTPLIELKEKLPPIGYSIPKQSNVMEKVYQLTKENLRAPVLRVTNDTKLYYDFASDIDDTWLRYLLELVNYANYTMDLDELGRVIFTPKQTLDSLQPIWTYNDDNSSILYPSVSLDQDMYGIPNVVEVVCSTENGVIYSKSVNDDPNSLASTISRGREIVYRDTNPSINGTPTQTKVNEYAEKLLKNLSTIEYKISYTHGYCPVRVGDCIRLNYSRAGINNVKAKVISQSIRCESGCSVTETAIYTMKLWE